MLGFLPFRFLSRGPILVHHFKILSFFYKIGTAKMMYNNSTKEIILDEIKIQDIPINMSQWTKYKHT